MKKKLFFPFFLFLLLIVINLDSINVYGMDDGGKCGPEAEWSVNGNGVLTISGAGKITENPWRLKYLYQISEVVVSDGITEIGDRIFSGLYADKVQLGKDVVKIGKSAFWSCSALKEIYLPESVKEIGAFAFAECKKLKVVKLSTNVKVIPENTFSGCKKLKEISLVSVSEIAQGAFSDCRSLDGISFGEKLTKIKNGAFEDCSGLSWISFSEGKPQVGKNAFKGCYLLRKVINHSLLDISLSSQQGGVIWKQNGKRVKKVSAGKTAVGTGKTYKIIYKNLKGKIYGKLPKSYRFTQVKKLPLKGKRDGYCLYGWRYGTDGWTLDISGFRGNIKLSPCWIKYEINKVSADTSTLFLNAGGGFFASYGMKIRYSEKRDMAGAQYRRLTYDKGMVKLSGLKRGKKYYIQFRAVQEEYHTPWSNKIVMKNL